ncbi:MAG: 4'-phosphopantetheinyl transferase superfamily protein [Bacteroidota bacterium]
MALWYEKHWQNGHQIGIWKIEETETYFLDRLDLHVSEANELAKMKGRRRLEWLASRYLVHLMFSDDPAWDRIPMLKDEFGKPHLNDAEFQVSFSHSHEFVAVILGNMTVGIDIQKFVPKITALERKFMREKESTSLLERTRLEHLHIYWGAKEALYKCYGRRRLDFKKNILVEPFDYQEFGQTTGQVVKDDFEQSYAITFMKTGNYFLVYALEKRTL